MQSDWNTTNPGSSTLLCNKKTTPFSKLFSFVHVFVEMVSKIFLKTNVLCQLLYCLPQY